MKLPIFVLVFASMQVTAKNLIGQKISLSLRDAPLEKAIHGIEIQSGFNFFYDHPVIKNAPPVTIHIKDVSLQSALKQCFRGQSDLTYVIVGKVIIIKKKNAKETSINSEAVAASQPERQINVHVTDSAGTALQGASVRVDASSAGGKTDAMGNVLLSAIPDSAMLIVSYVGYKTLYIKTVGQETVHVILYSTPNSLNEIVIVGYGTQRKGDITGAISSVNAIDMKDQPVGNLGQALEGKTSGVQIIQNSGAPGAAAQVRIRGLTSINNSDPLYVVDGIPLASNNINVVDPNNIASVEILKDASAQAIYGSRGANGVVLIKTKEGIKGHSDISVNAFTGVQQVAKTLDLLNAADYVRLNSEALTNAGRSVPFEKVPEDYTSTTDWQGALFRDAPIQNYNLAFSGGSDNLSYRLSAGYLSQEGTVVGSDYNRISLLLNTTFRPRKNIEIGENLAINKTQSHSAQTDYYNNAVNNAFSEDPTISVKDEDGNYTATKYSDIINPIARIHYLSSNSPYGEWGVIGNTYLQYKPIAGLSLKSSISVDLKFGDSKTFTPQFNVAPNFNNPIPTLYRQKDQAFNWTWDNTATYEAHLNTDNHLTVLAGISAERFTYDYVNGSNQGQPGNEDYLQYLDAGINNPQVGGSQQRWDLLSYIGRVNYDFKERYFLTATIRRDGSSKFGANEKYGNFPSASIGWLLTKESFLPASKALGYLKFRGSWGIVGNQASVGYYDFSSNINNNYYAIGNPATAQPTSEPAGLSNPDLKWEQIQQWNAGFDYRILNDHITGSFDYYSKKTKDMLLSLPILSESGFTSGPRTNAGSMMNSGIEFSADYSGTLSKDLKLTAGLHFATLRNRVLSLKEQGEKIFSAGFKPGSSELTQVGHSVSSFYGYVFDGIFQNEDQIKSHATQQDGTAPGDMIFRDVNKDGVINEGDRTFLGSPIPSFTYGFNMGLSYKSFDMNVSFSGVAGNKIAQAYKYYTDGLFVSNYNMEQEALGRWTGEGTSNHIPRLIASDPNDNGRVSSFYLTSGAYLRLQNISIGYTFPKAMLKKATIQSLRVYLAAQNLLTFTKYDGYDPEIGTQYSGTGGTLDLGIDNGTYPQNRTISVGINLSF